MPLPINERAPGVGTPDAPGNASATSALGSANSKSASYQEQNKIALDALVAGLPDYAERNVRSAYAQRPDYFRIDGKGRLRIRCRVDGRITPEAVARENAISRCTRLCSNRFEHYRAAGRYVDVVFLFGDGVRSGYERWFTEIGLKPGAGRGYLVDRADNGGSYTPGNIRWVSSAGSVRNRDSVTLSEQQVAEIKAVARHLPQRVLAERYKVALSTIGNIWVGRNYPDISRTPQPPVWAATHPEWRQKARRPLSSMGRPQVHRQRKPASIGEAAQ
jgi:hypothetical protein